MHVGCTSWYLACRHDLAQLLIRLRQFDKAEKVLRQALEAEEQGEGGSIQVSIQVSILKSMSGGIPEIVCQILKIP